jgi:hypothetical protein
MVQFLAMNIEMILEELIDERARIDRAIKVLSEGTIKTATKLTKRKKRKEMSQAARDRISAAQKARWAKIRKKDKA